MRLEVYGGQGIDSRGKPALTATARYGGFVGHALVPSGASRGSKEAFELRDGGRQHNGQGIFKAIGKIDVEIAPIIEDLDPTKQALIDRTMIDIDNTEDKRNLGGNTILAVSLAVARVAAAHKEVETYEHIAELHGYRGEFTMPVPMFNVINGGAHAENGLDFQEFMIVPNFNNFVSNMRAAMEIYSSLGAMLKEQGRVNGVGDEGGYSPTSFKATDGTGRVIETLDLLVNAIKVAGYTPKQEVSIAMDPAASEFFRDGRYELAGGQRLSPLEMVEFCEALADRFPIVSVEDFVAENDDDGWRLLTDRLGHRLQLVGDDRFVTNPTIFREGIEQRVGNAVLVKPNQVGTLTETLEVMKMAEDAHYNHIPSHRSGDTEDSILADLAVGTNSPQIKTGAPARGERTAKYNRLYRIDQELGRQGLEKSKSA